MRIPRRVVQVTFLIAGLLFGAGIFAFLVMKTGPENIISSLVLFGVLPLVGFISISLLNFCVYTIRWKMILDRMVAKSARVPFRRLFMHRMSGFAAGYLTPAAQVAGEPVRVAMLRSEGIPLKEATSSVILDLAFEISTYVIYVIAGITLALIQGLGVGGQLLWPLVFVLFLLAILFAFFFFTVSGSGFFHRLIRFSRLDKFKPVAKFEAWMTETEGIMSKFFVGRWKVVFLIVFLSFLMAAFRAVEVAFITYFLGTDIALRDAFLMSTLPGVALLLPIPAGLGVFEGSNAAMFAVLGITVNALAYTIIIRLRDFTFIALGVAHAVQRGEKLVPG